MSLPKIILGIFLFALATIILYILGIKRKMTQNKRLADMLLNNAARRVVKYINEHGSVTDKEIEYIIEDVKAKEFMSAKAAIIKNGADFRENLITYMVNHSYMVETGSRRGHRVFTLPGGVM